MCRLLAVLIVSIAVTGVTWADPESNRSRPTPRLDRIGSMARAANVAGSLETLDMFRGTEARGESLEWHPLYEQLNAEVRAGLRRASRRLVRDTLAEAIGLDVRLGRTGRSAVRLASERGDGRFDLDFGVRGLQPRLKVDMRTRRGAVTFAAEADGSMSLRYGGHRGLTQLTFGRDEDGGLVAGLRIGL